MKEKKTLKEKDKLLTVKMQEITREGRGYLGTIRTDDHTPGAEKINVTAIINDTNALEDLSWLIGGLGAEVKAELDITLTGDIPEQPEQPEQPGTDYETKYKALVEAIRKEYEETDFLLAPREGKSKEDISRLEGEYRMEWGTLRNLLKTAGEEI